MRLLFVLHAVIVVEMIVVFNQWNMYGPTILFSSWILQWKVVHMRIASWSILKIWDSKYPNVDVFPWLPLSDLKTAPVQGDDFSSGTSSRSTKLIHGGVRYLQKAIMKLDYKQVNASFFLRSWHLSAEFLVPLVILLYLPPMFIFHSREAVTCLPWMTACLEFSEVVLKDSYNLADLCCYHTVN